MKEKGLKGEWKWNYTRKGVNFELETCFIPERVLYENATE